MDILCNVQTCRKALTSALWVTSCSHSFCEEHAGTLKHKNKCPACSSVLAKRYDVIRQNSNPADDFRAMLLVGLRPEIVLDIAMRAISFWNYQVELELKFQAGSAKLYKGTAEKIKDNHAVMTRQLASANKTSDAHERHVEDLKITIQHLKDQIVAKERQLQKMQHLFNSIKSKTNSWPTDIPSSTAVDDNLPSGHMEDFLQPNMHGGKRNGHTAAKKSAEFVFDPCFGLKK